MTNYMDDLDESQIGEIVKQGSWAKLGLKVKLQEEKKEEAKAPVNEETTEQVKEEVVEHVCPLCESKLSEALSDDLITERVGIISEAILEVAKEDESEESEDSDESAKE
jgi:hypothetical protein